MIPLEIAGQILSGVPQDVPAGTGSLQGAIDFLPLFKRALGNGVAAQVTDGPVPEGLIGMSNAPADEEGRTVRQGSSDMSGGKGQAERGVDPALAILIAALSQPQQDTQVLTVPGLDRVVDLQPPAIAAAPPVETTLQVAVLPPLLPTQGARPTREPADAGANDPRPVGQPVQAFQVDLAAVQTDQPETVPGLDRVVDLQPPAIAAAPPVETTLQVAVLPPLLPTQGARPTREPADSPLVEIGPPLRPGVATITTSPVQAGSLQGNASTHAKPDLPEEGATPSGTAPRPSAVSERPEAPVVAQRSPLPPQGPRPTLEPAVARPTLLMPLSDADQPEGGQRSEDLLFTKDTRLLMTSAKEVQDGISRSNEDQAMEQVGGLPPMVSSVEGQARAAVPPSEETTGRSSLPEHSAIRFSTPSDPSEVFGPEAFEGEGSPERVQVGQADSDRAAMRQGSPRPEATQGMQQDRPASDSEGGSRSSDRSSPPPGDGRQIGGDVALAAPPRAEELRSGSAAPSLHARALVDQVAEQVATAARLSLRNEGGHVQLRLHPQALGELVIEVSWQDSGIVAAIKAQSHIAGDLLASDLGRLRTALGEQGIPVSGLGVQVGLDFRHWSFEGNGFRGSPTIGYAPEAIPWRDRGSALPMAPSMKTDSLIDITV